MGPPPTPDRRLGVFETLLVIDGAPIEVDAHLERLGGSVEQLYGARLPDDAGRLVADGARGTGRGRLRLDARPDAAGLKLEVRAVAIDPAIPFPPLERGADLRTTDVADWRGGHKWADRRLLDSLDADAAPATALLVDRQDGAVLETTRANLFAVRADGVVVTPPADGRVLPGVTRALTIELAGVAGIEVVEAAVTRADLDSASEIFVTGSVRGVEPVRSIDGRAAGDTGAAVTTTVATALRQRWIG